VIFRREPIHKKLARQASLDLSSEPREDPGPVDPGPHWGETGINGLPRPRRWDAVGAAEAPGLTGDELHFVALPTGDLVVDEEQPEGATVAPLARAIAQSVDPPYRAEAVRRGGDAWAVAARRIEVAELDDAPGQELQLAVSGGERVLTVDGERFFGSIPALERLGQRAGDAYVVRASRLRDHVWEVESNPL
jgi:hypothetical protein